MKVRCSILWLLIMTIVHLSANKQSIVCLIHMIHPHTHYHISLTHQTSPSYVRVPNHSTTLCVPVLAPIPSSYSLHALHSSTLFWLHLSGSSGSYCGLQGCIHNCTDSLMKTQHQGGKYTHGNLGISKFKS